VALTLRLLPRDRDGSAGAGGGEEGKISLRASWFASVRSLYRGGFAAGSEACRLRHKAASALWGGDGWCSALFLIFTDSGHY
jgi:hypothetical protein